MEMNSNVTFTICKGRQRHFYPPFQSGPETYWICQLRSPTRVVFFVQKGLRTRTRGTHRTSVSEKWKENTPQAVKVGSQTCLLP